MEKLEELAKSYIFVNQTENASHIAVLKENREMVPNVVIVDRVKYVGRMESVEQVRQSSSLYEYRIHIHGTKNYFKFLILNDICEMITFFQ